MAKKDRIKIKILDDGRLVATTGKISLKNHIEADRALKELTELLGGLETIESSKAASKDHHHHHADGTHHSH